MEERENEDGSKYTAYTYDYHEIKAPETALDMIEIMKHPEDYMEYEYHQPSETEKRIAQLEEQNAMLMECLLEVSSVIYA